MPRNDLKAYTTVLARIPQDLADEVKRYAGIHRCTVSELIRDGLEMRLEAGDVPGRSTRHPGEPGDEVLHEVLQAIKALTPMGQAAIRQTMSEVLHEVLPKYVSRQQGQQAGYTEVLQGITEVLPLVPALTPAPQLTEGHTTVIPMVPTILQPATEVLPGHTAFPQLHTHSMPSILPLEASPPGHDEAGHTEVLQGITGVLPHESEEVPHDSKGMTSVLPQHPQEHAHEHEGMTEVLHTPGAVDHVGYDPGKFSLGKLCPQGHAHQDTGKSLLRRSNQRCWECDKAMKRAIKARQRAARQEEPR
jgi:hypothetical protein